MYLVTATWVDPKTGRRRTLRRRIEAASARAAFKRKIELVDEARAANAKPAAPRQRLAEYAASWIRSGAKSGRLRKSTAATYAIHLDVRILPVLGDYYLDAIEPSDVRRWFDGVDGGVDVVNGALRVLRTMLGHAEREELIRSNPSRHVEFRRKRWRETNAKVLSPSEVSRLVSAAATVAPKWYPLIRTLFETGGRWGEVSALKWTDVDFPARSIRIARAHWHGEIGETKTGVVRTVPISAELVEVLQSHRARLVREQAPGTADGWVFPSANGGLSLPSASYKPLDKAARAAGLGVKVRPHHFRHTMNNLLRQVAGGQVTRAITGHVTEAMTEHYSEVSLAERKTAHEAVLRLVRSTDVDFDVDFSSEYAETADHAPRATGRNP